MEGKNIFGLIIIGLIKTGNDFKGFRAVKSLVHINNRSVKGTLYTFRNLIIQD